MRKGVIPCLAVICICLLPLGLTLSVPSVEDFDLEGIAIFQCQCVAHACPCQKNGAPTHGTCEAADFVHVRTGHYGKIRLDGLNAVTIGNLVDQRQDRIYATVYIDQKATAAQRQAFTSIEQFLNDAYETSRLKGLHARFVPLAFHESAEKTMYSITIPGILDAETIRGFELAIRCFFR